MTLFFITAYSSSIYDFFENAGTQIRKGNPSAAILDLESWVSNSRQKRFVDRALYLLSWAYYEKGDYAEALNYAKKIVLNYNQSRYYYPSLLLSAAISYKSGHIRGAQEVLNWLAAHPPLEEKYLFAAYYLKAVVEKKTQPERSGFSLNIFRLCMDFLPQAMEMKQAVSVAPVKKEEKAPVRKKEEKKESAPLVVEEQEQKKKEKPEEDSVSRKTPLKNEKETPYEKRLRELKEREKKVAIREKELEIMKILLEEKKRLLYLKEQYLEQKEESIQKKETQP
jgi:hypothetical protein